MVCFETCGQLDKIWSVGVVCQSAMLFFCTLSRAGLMTVGLVGGIWGYGGASFSSYVLWCEILCFLLKYFSLIGGGLVTEVS